jgi:PPK2 family polyphosphate:nucleotide phosphotransferase
MHNFQDYRIKPGSKVNLQQIKTDDDGHLSKKQGETEFEKLHKRLIKLQELLYAEGKHALLVILQAMDTGGKDSTIRSVFQGVNPQGCQVTSFKAPNETEQKHDFLWRIHQNTPPLGYIGIFNRSHYEDVLVARVKKLVPEARWQARYEHINCFEQMLHDEGTAIVKFFLHISQDYQKERLQRRLDKPDKRWKFNPADLVNRQRWEDYQTAFEVMLTRCSTAHAPWYVIPAEHHWYRNLLVTSVLVNQLESFNMNYPEPDFEPAQIVIE